ncbi:hypothetical protein [Nitrosospira multiformis]|nr:hypothetical protein [Nitrosospira multiformis]
MKQELDSPHGIRPGRGLMLAGRILYASHGADILGKRGHAE